MNKRKLINDPVYGFINIPTELIYEIIDHPYFQRLRRIRQLGLAEFVYTGATHTRFQHALGAMYLMGQAIDTLRSKEVEISEEEKQSVQIAILLHDLGHGPFSHVLEYSLLNNVPHEYISSILMNELNEEFDGSLTLAIKMFDGTYERPFFHQLISSQVDIDRLDYLHRDSFFTGVVEGTIGVQRIIKMMCVVNEELAIEEKGILSIENFLNARRIMYWQVYLHKTSIAAEVMLKSILKLAEIAILKGQEMSCSQTLSTFLNNKPSAGDFSDKNIIRRFTSLDDSDILSAIKLWTTIENNDTLNFLCKSFLNRKLFKIKLFNDSIPADFERTIKELLLSSNVSADDMNYLMVNGTISNKAYISENSTIKIAMKSGEIKDIMDASDLPTIHALSNIVKKSYLSWVNPLYLR